jgi:hypothetical protein
MIRVKIKGENYVRSVEMLGDVEKITWFKHFKHNNSNEEIFDHDEMNTLEEAYESLLMAELIPALPII